MTTQRTVYPNIEAFRRAHGGDTAELDLGAWWTDNGRDFPRYRVSVVHDTGDVYAFCFNGGAVELLGTLPGSCEAAALPLVHHRGACVYNAASAVLAGWSELGNGMVLDWVRERLAGVS